MGHLSEGREWKAGAIVLWNQMACCSGLRLPLSTQATEQLLEIGSGFGRPRQPPARAGVLDTERGGVQHRPVCTAAVGEWFAVQGPVVNALAAEGSALFSEMDADLVRAARLQAAF